VGDISCFGKNLSNIVGGWWTGGARAFCGGGGGGGGARGMVALYGKSTMWQ